MFIFAGFLLIFGAEGKIAKISQPAKIRTSIVHVHCFPPLCTILSFCVIYIYILKKNFVSQIKKYFKKKKHFLQVANFRNLLHPYFVFVIIFFIRAPFRSFWYRWKS